MQTATQSWVYDDGGRMAAGYVSVTRDCVCRAIAIASEMPYDEVYQRLADGAGKERKSRGRSARNGIFTSRKWFKEFMSAIGFTWTPTMTIGSGCRVHLDANELPSGRLVVSVSRHYVAMIDGVIHDTHDPSRDNTRCVYGYWKLEA
jgi:hypothetical protein